MAEIRVSATGELKLYDSDDSNYVSFKSAGTVSSNVAWVLPSADGSSGQMLSTDGSGTLSWATASSADPSSADGDTLGTASAEWSDLYLADGGIVYFGNDQDIRLTHNADKGLILKHSATADDKPVILTLQTGETDMAANDVIGKIEFQAPDEGTGTDAVLVSAAIQAVAEGDHSSSSNATRIEFMVGASEAAAKKMQLTSAGKLEVDGGLDVEGGVVFNEDSADVDFRVESNGEANIFAVNGGDDIVLLRKASNTSSASGTNGVLKIMTNDNAGGQMQLGSNDAGYAWVQASDGSSAYPLVLQATGSNVLFGKTSAALGTAGTDIEPGGTGVFTASGNHLLNLNRLASDGDIARIYQATNQEGSISVSGTTVAYNTFCGAHWSRLADNSKPTILRGTVMETIATMIDWYQAVADVAESTDSDGNVTPAHQVKESIALPNGKSVGDAVTFKSKGKDYTGKYVKEDNEQLPMCKISNTADSKSVYGVFMAWDDSDDGLDGDVNDMHVASLGAFVVRIHKDQTVAIGDYLVSNGDGTAKKQADDILKSSTIAKVTSTTKTITHADGSYCVPCTLHCG